MSKKIYNLVTQHLDSEIVGGYKIICIAITGSNAYGINTPDSDIDFMGIYLPNEDYIIGISEPVDNVQINPGYRRDEKGYKENPIQGVMYDLRKWYDLTISQNPNVLELLWHQPNMYVYTDSLIFPTLLKNRDKLLSKQLKHSYSAYAHAQITRVKKLNEKASQNPRRKENFEKFGYDIHAASTCIRLLNTGFDALVGYKITVLRPERHLLIAIREGKYSYEELRELANSKQKLIDTAYLGSTLRNEVDGNFANKLLIKIMKEHLCHKSEHQMELFVDT